VKKSPPATDKIIYGFLIAAIVHRNIQIGEDFL
jgi:hypothetical protein